MSSDSESSSSDMEIVKSSKGFQSKNAKFSKKGNPSAKTGVKGSESGVHKKVERDEKNKESSSSMPTDNSSTKPPLVVKFDEPSEEQKKNDSKHSSINQIPVAADLNPNVKRFQDPQEPNKAASNPIPSFISGGLPSKQPSDNPKSDAVNSAMPPSLSNLGNPGPPPGLPKPGSAIKTPTSFTSNQGVNGVLPVPKNPSFPGSGSGPPIAKSPQITNENLDKKAPGLSNQTAPPSLFQGSQNPTPFPTGHSSFVPPGSKDAASVNPNVIPTLSPVIPGRLPFTNPNVNPQPDFKSSIPPPLNSNNNFSVPGNIPRNESIPKTSLSSQNNNPPPPNEVFTANTVKPNNPFTQKNSQQFLNPPPLSGGAPFPIPQNKNPQVASEILSPPPLGNPQSLPFTTQSVKGETMPPPPLGNPQSSPFTPHSVKGVMPPPIGGNPNSLPFNINKNEKTVNPPPGLGTLPQTGLSQVDSSTPLKSVNPPSGPLFQSVIPQSGNQGPFGNPIPASLPQTKTSPADNQGLIKPVNRSPFASGAPSTKFIQSDNQGVPYSKPSNNPPLNQNIMNPPPINSPSLYSQNKNPPGATGPMVKPNSFIPQVPVGNSLPFANKARTDQILENSAHGSRISQFIPNPKLPGPPIPSNNRNLPPAELKPRFHSETKDGSDEINLRKTIPLEEKNKKYEMLKNLPTANIKKEIKKVDPEMLLQVLEKILDQAVELVDYNKIILEYNHIEKELLAFVDVGYLKASQILDKLRNHMKCCGCHNPPIIELSCGHLLCDECCKKRIHPDLDSNNPEIILLCCPQCHQCLRDIEIEHIFAGENRIYRNEIEKSIRIQMLPNGINCMTCHKKKYQFFESTCLHMCSECIAESIRNRNIVCEVCAILFENYESIINYQVKCDSCQTHVFYIGDMVKTMHDHKMICNICLSESFNQCTCKCCSRKLSKIEKVELNEFLFMQCQPCGGSIDKRAVRHLDCCGAKMCFTCADKSGRCYKCKTPIV